MRRIATISAAAFALFLGSLTAGACGPDPETLCKRLCDCGDCAEQEQQGCAEGLEDAEKDAENDECGAEYDTYVECLDENLECSAGGANESKCQEEHDDLVDCIDEPVIVLVGDACIDLCKEVAGCAGTDPALCDAGPNPCTYEQNRCAACLAGGSADLCDPEQIVNAALPCLQVCLEAVACQPGSQSPCQCPDGTTGTSTCNGAAYGPCDCADPPS
jgi:hypothetical protein